MAEAFRQHGITYPPSALTRSELFLEMLHTLNSGYVELLDHPGSSPSLAGLALWRGLD